jgi:hypothetical protein
VALIVIMLSMSSAITAAEDVKEHAEQESEGKPHHRLAYGFSLFEDGQ